MNIVIPIITFVVGAVAGFAIGVFYLRKQFANMAMDQKQIQQMARKMGMNLNQKQLNQMSRMINNMNRYKKKK
ncbi:YneF family protein [Tepidibacillus sp. LV47]|uniref:YneF family protein n=1 Tax=Tepidibacillus sp. LV47 TaxID=3398228 RepID=UPI003AB09E0F